MAKKQAVREPATDGIRSRIKEFVPEYPTESLIDHPLNWRIHPDEQKLILEGLLQRHGKVDALLVYDSTKYGGRVIIDGHQRRELTGSYPLLVLDVDDDEAAEILATYNPLSQMAKPEKDTYRGLFAQLAKQDAKDQQQLETLRTIASGVLQESVGSAEEPVVDLKNVDTAEPPKMIWTVVGVPIFSYGRVATQLEELRKLDGVIFESTASDLGCDDGKESEAEKQDD